MAKRKYTMVVYLKMNESSDTKELLKKNKFMIVVHDETTDDYYDDNEESISKIINSNHDIRFLCMYNRETPLSQELIRRLDNDPSVISFSIHKLAG